MKKTTFFLTFFLSLVYSNSLISQVHPGIQYEIEPDQSGFKFKIDLCNIECDIYEPPPNCENWLYQETHMAACMDSCTRTYDVITQEVQYMECERSCALPDLGAILLPFSIFVRTEIYFGPKGSNPLETGTYWPSFYTTNYFNTNFTIPIPINLQTEFPNWNEGAYCIVHTVFLNYALGDHNDWCEYTIFECYDSGKK